MMDKKILNPFDKAIKEILSSMNSMVDPNFEDFVKLNEIKYLREVQMNIGIEYSVDGKTNWSANYHPDHVYYRFSHNGKSWTEPKDFTKMENNKENKPRKYRSKHITPRETQQCIFVVVVILIAAIVFMYFKSNA